MIHRLETFVFVGIHVGEVRSVCNIEPHVGRPGCIVASQQWRNKPCPPRPLYLMDFPCLLMSPSSAVHRGEHPGLFMWHKYKKRATEANVFVSHSFAISLIVRSSLSSAVLMVQRRWVNYRGCDMQTDEMWLNRVKLGKWSWPS